MLELKFAFGVNGSKILIYYFYNLFNYFTYACIIKNLLILNIVYNYPPEKYKKQHTEK